MKIKISEVWNYRGESKELAIIETHPSEARIAVLTWMTNNRPDLPLATGVNDHGFHAIAI